MNMDDVGNKDQMSSAMDVEADRYIVDADGDGAPVNEHYFGVDKQ